MSSYTLIVVLLSAAILKIILANPIDVQESQAALDACSSGYYYSTNATQCIRCSECTTDVSVILHPCTATTDAVCVNCEDVSTDNQELYQQCHQNLTNDTQTPAEQRDESSDELMTDDEASSTLGSGDVDEGLLGVHEPRSADEDLIILTVHNDTLIKNIHSDSSEEAESDGSGDLELFSSGDVDTDLPGEEENLENDLENSNDKESITVEVMHAEETTTMEGVLLPVAIPGDGGPEESDLEDDEDDDAERDDDDIVILPPPSSADVTDSQEEKLNGTAGHIVAAGSSDEDPKIIRTAEPTPVFGIIMAAVTSGIIFFGIGFWFTKCRRKKAVFTPQSNNVSRENMLSYRSPHRQNASANSLDSAGSKIEMLRRKQQLRRDDPAYQSLPIYEESEIKVEVPKQQEAPLVSHVDDAYEDVEERKQQLEGLLSPEDKENLANEDAAVEKKLALDSDGEDDKLKADEEPVVPKLDEPDGHYENHEIPAANNNRDDSVEPARTSINNNRDSLGDNPHKIPPVPPKKPVNRHPSFRNPLNYPLPSNGVQHEDRHDSTNQSPINIDTSLADADQQYEMHALTFFYVPSNVLDIVNTGTTINVNIMGTGSLLVGGPLGQKRFCIHHIEFKWGSTDSEGSEHTVDNTSYAAEIQLVHWNRDDYNSYEEACMGDEGLAVMSVFVQIGQEYHDGFGPISRTLQFIRFKDQRKEFMQDFDPAVLLPDNSFDYWAYTGSMTWPPYTENVTWIIFKSPIKISKDQILSLRRLKKYEERYHNDILTNRQSGVISDNNRRVCPLGGRTISASFVST